jgi:hypothetical protein
MDQLLKKIKANPQGEDIAPSQTFGESKQEASQS